MDARFFTVTALLSFAAAIAGETLHYNTDAVVRQEQSIILRLNQGVLPLNSTISHQMEASLELHQGELSHPPLPTQVTFTPLHASITLESKELTLSYHSDTATTPAFLGELTYMMNQPLQLTVTRDLDIVGNAEALKRLDGPGPQIHDFTRSWLQLLFILANEELIVGKSYTHPLPTASRGMQPETLTVTIETIDDDGVTGSLEGTIPPHRLTLTTEKGGAATLAGRVTGTLRWERHNALIFNYSGITIYSGTLTTDGIDLTTELTLNQTISSHVDDY